MAQVRPSSVESQRHVHTSNFSLKILTSPANSDTQRFQSNVLGRSEPRDGKQTDNMEELSRIQKENAAILRSYISMNPITLRFNNPEIERDYVVYFEGKRHFSVMTCFAAIGVVSQCILIDAGYFGSLQGSANQVSLFIVIEIVTIVQLLAYLARFVVFLEMKQSQRALRKKGEMTLSSMEKGLQAGDEEAQRVKELANTTRRIRGKFPRDTVIIALSVLSVCLVTLVNMDEESSCNVGVLFALVFSSAVLSAMSYLTAIVVELTVFIGYLIASREIVSINAMSFVACIVCFTYSLRVTELAIRRDFRLTRRLAAENIDVRVDATTRNWFEFGRAKVKPGKETRASPSSPSNYEIKFQDLVLGETLGSGSFGEVVAGKWRGTDVAIKKIHGAPVQEAVVDFGIESAIMASLRHPNILMYLGTCLSPVMMVMELMPRGSLHQILHLQNTKLDWSLKLRLLMDAARGVNFLHMLEDPILHNDLKSLNLLVDNDWRCKVSDFGFSKIRQAVKQNQPGFNHNISNSKGDSELPNDESYGGVSTHSSASDALQKSPQTIDQDEGPAVVATIGWASPESIRQEQPTEKNDVYAFGVVIFEVLTQALPFASVSKDAIPLLVLGGKRPTDFLDHESFIASIVDKEKKEAISKLSLLMKQCWDPNPASRPSFSAILTHLDGIVKTYFGARYKDWQEDIIFPRPVQLGAMPQGDVESFTINPEDLQMGPKIGAGAYGEVYEAIYHGTHVAVKQFHNSGLPADVLKEFNKECRLMLKMRHPNIVLFMGSWTKPPKLVLVTELLTRGSLYYTYNSNTKPTDATHHLQLLLKITEGMALGLNYLHNQNPPIIHRDMKSPNVLLDDNWNAKIADFGLSRIKEEGKIMTSVGSPLWAAPEVLRGEESGFPSDVYSFAVVVWEIIEWQEPYPGMSPASIMRQVAFNNMRPKLSPKLAPSIRKLLQQCWADNPNKRPTFGDIIKTVDSISTELQPKSST